MDNLAEDISRSTRNIALSAQDVKAEDTRSFSPHSPGSEGYQTSEFRGKDQVHFEEAEQMYQQALDRYEKQFNPHPETVFNTLHDFGLLYTEWDRFDKAEEMYLRAFEGKESILGPNHISTLETLGNLANLYTGHGDFDNVEQMYRRVLEGFELQLGHNDSSTLRTASNLGILCAGQGKLEEAEELYRKALHGMEKTLGPENPSVLEIVMNLGNLYRQRNKPDHAERMYRRGLEGFEKALGSHRLASLQAANNLGLFYEDQQNLDEAEKLYRRALAGLTKILGRDDKFTLKVTGSMHKLHRQRNRIGEADKSKCFDCEYLRKSAFYTPPMRPTRVGFDDLTESAKGGCRACQFLESVIRLRDPQAFDNKSADLHMSWMPHSEQFATNSSKVIFYIEERTPQANKCNVFEIFVLPGEFVGPLNDRISSKLLSFLTPVLVNRGANPEKH